MRVQVKGGFESGVDAEEVISWCAANGFDAFKVLAETCYVDTDARLIEFEEVVSETWVDDKRQTEHRSVPLIIDLPASLTV